MRVNDDFSGACMRVSDDFSITCMRVSDDFSMACMRVSDDFSTACMRVSYDFSMACMRVSYDISTAWKRRRKGRRLTPDCCCGTAGKKPAGGSLAGKDEIGSLRIKENRWHCCQGNGEEFPTDLGAERMWATWSELNKTELSK